METEAKVEAKIRGYVDPRTGEYKRATEENEAEVQADLGFIIAWNFYWNGPLVSPSEKRPVYEREEWLGSEARRAWVRELSDEQRAQLEDSFPPEEVPVGGVL